MVCGADSVVAPAAVGKVVVAAAETETAPRTTETKRAVSCIFANSGSWGFDRGVWEYLVSWDEEAGIKARERIGIPGEMIRNG